MSLKPPASGPTLVFQPSWWEIVLLDGSVAEVRADGAKEDAESLRFIVLAQGEPNVEFELFRIPRAAVVSWDGGWPESRSGSS
jgi:hypothetical protein